MNDLLKHFHMEEISPFFDECYKTAKEETGYPVWLTEDFIREAAREQPFFEKDVEDQLVAAMSAVRENADLVLFARTLYHMLTPRVHHESILGGLAFPTPPEGEETLAYDIFAFYPLFAHIRAAYAELLSRGADVSVLRETAKNVGASINASEKMIGRFGFTKLYFLWCTTHKNGALFKIDRFSFEVRDKIDLGVRVFRSTHGEIKILMSGGISVHASGLLAGSAGAEGDPAFVTEYSEDSNGYVGYPVTDNGLRVFPKACRLEKAEWALVYAPGDNLISVHIPADQPFDSHIVARSLETGKAFFEKLYPEKRFRGYMCISWLLSPELSDILKPSSNILAFGNLYERFPVISEGLDIFHFVFHKTVTTVTEDVIASLPESNSLERGLKRLYESGGYLHELGGIIPF